MIGASWLQSCSVKCNIDLYSPIIGNIEHNYRLVPPVWDRADCCKVRMDCCESVGYTRLQRHASFGPKRPVKAGVRGELGCSIPMRETESRRLVHVTPTGGLGTKNRAHAMDHACSLGHTNAELTRTGEIG